MSTTIAALRSELLNIRATTTARWLLVGSIAMASLSLIANLATFETDELAAQATIQQAMHASTVATITFAFVAGLVSSTSDYRFGRMDQLLLTEPRPSRVLATKNTIGFLVGVIYGLAGSGTALGVVATYYELAGASISLASATVVRPLFGVVVASGLFAIIGIGVGTAVRNQPAALAGGLAALLIVQPPLLLGMPDIGRWLPGAAGLAMTLAPDPAMLQQVLAGAVLLGWTVLAVLAGNHRLKTTGA